MARGRYIAFLDSDDAWLECKLEKQVAFMEEQGASFTYGDYAIVDGGNGAALGRYVAPPRLQYDQLLTRCPIGCSTAAYNQEAVGKRYMPAIRRGQDWALWLALLRSGVEPGSMEYSAVTHPVPLPRIHGGTRSSTDAVHSTRVLPIETSTEPAAISV